jgi:hypothetical protein
MRKDDEMNYEEAMKNCIFRFISGSHAYGTERPDSDQDFRGVFIATLSNAFDLFQSSFVGSGPISGHLKSAIADLEIIQDGYCDTGVLKGIIERIRLAMINDHGDLNLSVGTVHKPGVDEELQELRKFLKLAAESNPNIIEFLYVERLITHETPVWKKIRENRGMFLSKKARHTFAGYAHAQLERIKTHRGYLMNPPEKQPERKDYGLDPMTKVAREHQNAILSLPEQWLGEDSREYVRNERKFQDALSAWHSYHKWAKERNPYRKELEKKYGYDVKHGMHLLRLSRMGTEILEKSEVNVYRPDREELRGVLRGEWTYEKLVEHAEKIDANMEELYTKSTLRNSPDRKGISDLYREICEEHYGIKIN